MLLLIISVLSFINYLIEIFMFLRADYDALRSLDADDNIGSPSMTEEEINALPVHQYKVQPKHAYSGPNK